MSEFRQREIDAARRALNLETKLMKARRGLNAAALAIDQKVLFQAVAHATCFRAYFSGWSRDDLSSRLREEKTQSSGLLTMGDVMKAKLEKSLGLVRTTDAERTLINKTLARLYAVTEELPTDSALDIFVPFLRRYAPQVGLPLDIAIVRIENLDALMRFSGPAKRYIPDDQFGL